MHNSNYTEHYRTRLYCLSRTKHDCTSATCVFNRNTCSLVTSKRRSTVRYANHCQGQLQTAQSVSIAAQLRVPAGRPACLPAVSLYGTTGQTCVKFDIGNFTKILKSGLVKTGIITGTLHDEMRTFVICLCNEVNKHVWSSFAHRTIQTDSVTITL